MGRMSWNEYLRTERAKEIRERVRRHTRKVAKEEKISEKSRRLWEQMLFMHEVSKAYKRHKELVK